MHLISRLGLIAAATFFTSCDRNLQSTTAPVATLAAPAVSYATPEAKWLEAEFTPWMSRAELQFLQEKNPAEVFFAHVEGRNNQGRNEYRAIAKPFAAAEYEQWAVFWGINEAELFDWELRLLKTGFTRKDMQAFADSTGQALYQIVWLKPHEKPEEQARSLAALATEEPMPAPTAAAPIIAPSAEPPPQAVAAAAVNPPPPTKKLEASEPLEKPGKSSIYIVQPGDSLGKIAKRKGVTVAELKKINELKSDTLKIGQKLVIQKSTP